MIWMFLELWILTLIFRLTWDIQVIITPSKHVTGHTSTNSDIFDSNYVFYWFCRRLTSLLSWNPMWRWLLGVGAGGGEIKEDGDDQWKLFQVAADIGDVEASSDTDTHLASVRVELELDNWERRGSSQFRSYSWFNDILTATDCHGCRLRLAATAN